MRAFLLFTILLFSANGFAQKKINLKHADNLLGSQKQKFQRLVGSVVLEHEGAIMTCDSAHLFAATNSLIAYSHVHISQGDSVNVYGDNLKYDGNTRRADLTGNVTMTDGDMTLTTNAITYDMKAKVASYSSGGRIVSQNNVLTSQIGAYSPEAKALTFKKNVVLTNPQYVMNCDTLRYMPVSKVAYFIGPTTIRANNNTNIIYCENGYYDTYADYCQFQKNAKIITKDQILHGDSLCYNRKTGIGKAIRNVEIIDTAQDVVIRGDLAIHDENASTSLITGHTLFIQIFDTDSLFLHADTLRSVTLYCKRKTEMENYRDSGKIVTAFHHVRFFKQDLQGRCDSLGWTTTDSTMRLYHDPVMWSDGSQITSDSINIITSGGHILKMEMNVNAFIVSKEDSLRYNQIKGKRMTGYFMENELRKIYVEGNGQTVYYVKDSTTMVGVNRADCSRLMIELKDQKVNGIRFYGKPDGSLYPPLDLDPKEAILKGFEWREAERPDSVSALFTK